jgi:hypothetical protein
MLRVKFIEANMGASLKLDGSRKGINSNARERAVIHGADYVSDSFIKTTKDWEEV